jgi:hypothetical protein
MKIIIMIIKISLYTVRILSLTTKNTDKMLNGCVTAKEYHTRRLSAPETL